MSQKQVWFAMGILLFLLCAWVTEGAEPAAADGTPATAVTSRIEKTAAGELILVQEAVYNAPVAKVWKAYTTTDGWTAWAAPNAKVDLRAGGTILTNYNPEAELGDPGTNTLRILNYVPERVLTLQADLAPNWPEIMKKDADRLQNVILFEELNPEQTRIRSYGVGYSQDPEYDNLMKFFISANEELMGYLGDYVERGVRATD